MSSLSEGNITCLIARLPVSLSETRKLPLLSGTGCGSSSPPSTAIFTERTLYGYYVLPSSANRFSDACGNEPSAKLAYISALMAVGENSVYRSLFLFSLVMRQVPMIFK